MPSYQSVNSLPQDLLLTLGNKLKPRVILPTPTPPKLKPGFTLSPQGFLAYSEPTPRDPSFVLKTHDELCIAWRPAKAKETRTWLTWKEANFPYSVN